MIDVQHSLLLITWKSVGNIYICHKLMTNFFYEVHVAGVMTLVMESATVLLCIGRYSAD